MMKKFANQVAKLAIGGILLGPATRGIPAQGPAPASPSAPPSSATASAAKSTPTPPDTVVLKIGDQQLTAADFDALAAAVGRPGFNLPPQQRRSLAQQYVMWVVLSRQALAEKLDSLPDVRRRIEISKMAQLASAAAANINQKAEPTSEEINQYYAAHKSSYEEVQVRQVSVHKKPDNAKEGTPGLSAPEAKAKADEIRKALAAGADPKKLAEQYKSDAIVDTAPRSIPHRQTQSDRDKALFALKEGEFTENQETPYSISFMQVIKHAYRDLKDVGPMIGKMLQQEKTQAAMEDLKRKASVWMDDDFFNVPTPTATPQPALPGNPAQPGTPQPSGVKSSTANAPPKQ